MPALNDEQLQAISNIERACSILSLIGSLFVIVTFCVSSSFHKPVNRLVFYATFGNVLTNVGTLISRTYVEDPNGVGCQFQAFMIQMFMPADAFWITAMAINVYLTFYHRFDAQRLRRMEVPYLLCCYGIPFVPALVYLFVRDSHGHRVYGNAVLWCWVTPEWNLWRILTFYGPVWCVFSLFFLTNTLSYMFRILILITMFIYARAGRTIYEKRKDLQHIRPSDSDPLSVDVTATIKTTEVTVTSTEATPENAIPLQPMGRGSSAIPPGGYIVTIAADHPHPPISPRFGTGPQQQAAGRRPTTSSGAGGTRATRRVAYEVNNAAWAYTKCAILFFTALLITWIPSSANRVYSIVHPSTIPTLEFMSAFVLPLQGFWNAIIYATTSWTACKNLWSDMRQGRRPVVTELVGGMSAREQQRQHQQRNYNEELGDRSARRARKGGESESMTELAGSDGRSI